MWWPTRRQPWLILSLVFAAAGIAVLLMRLAVDGAWPIYVWTFLVALSVACNVIARRRGEVGTVRDRLPTEQPPQ
jgi:hypothetical protein